MAQVLKPELRESILCAGEALFAEAGYQGATMAQIAERAGMSTGNLYRYFKSKDELFNEVISDEFAARFMRLLRARMKSLMQASDVSQLDEQARADGEALLSFWIHERRKVVVLLDRAAGSRFEDFSERFVDALTKPTLEKLSAQAGRPLSPAVKFLLAQLFRNTVRAIVAILDAHADETKIREAIAGFWSYQLAGMSGFAKWATHA